MERYQIFRLVMLIIVVVNSFVIQEGFGPFYFILAMIYFVLDDIRDEIKKARK